MDSVSHLAFSSAPEVAALLTERAALRQENHTLRQRLQAAEQQLHWLKRQLFGAKSERRLVETAPGQLSLGEGLIRVPESGPPTPVRTVAAHTRRLTLTQPTEDESDTPLFFDDSVPQEVIELRSPELIDLAPEDYEVIGEKVTHRLAQRPGSYVILKYVRPLIKRRADQSLQCAPAPQGVLEHSRADVSFLAGLLVDKFAYHQPLYRQHQRLLDSGIQVSRGWLTQLVHRSAALLEPVFQAQLESVRESRVKAMDETPIKAGLKGRGKMRTGYFWPVYGERDEVVFLFYPSRATEHVYEALGQSAPDGGVLLTDGYGAYERYAKKIGLTHAQCWSHTRRYFVKAEPVEPEAAGWALDTIGELYLIEAQIRELKLSGEPKRRYRLEHAKPVVERFFAWAEGQLSAQAFLPSNPLTTALGYALERRTRLEVYLTDPEVPIDTNHLERTLRPIPMGRRNWLFCWTEVGAKTVGIVQSLLTTCRLHGINPYDYFVDVLQRIDRHPAAEVRLLTPRLWKQHYSANPLRSPLHTLRS